MNKYLLIFCAWFPPTIGGTPTVMRNLLRAFPGDAFHTFRRHVEPQEAGEIPLSYSTFMLPNWLRQVRGSHYLLIPWLVWHGLSRARRRELSSVLVVIPEASFALAGWIVSKLTGLPLYLYMHDTYAEQQVHPLDKLLARWFEPTLFRMARRILVISEGLQAFYRDKYGIDTVVIPHIRDVVSVGNADSVLSPQHFNIVFTGDIYDMNLDAVQNLVRVMEEHSDPNVRLTISTRSSREFLERHGICGQRVRQLFLHSREEVYALQRCADVLFLPLAFNSPYSLEVSTCFPTKAIEYLAARRPILVHCPVDSFLARFTRERKLGLLVDSADRGTLKRAIDCLKDNEEYRQEMVDDAADALEYFDPKLIVRLFASVLEVESREEG